MGFLDAVLGGRKKLKGVAPDRLFAMTTAYVTMETGLGMKSAGSAGIVFQPLATADFDQILKDAEELLHGTAEETGSTLESADDEFGYRWIILRDPDFEDTVVSLNTISTELQGGGYGERLLAAVFPFDDKGSGLLHLQLQARRVLPVRAGLGRQAARLRARAAAEGPARQGPAFRGGHDALVPPLGDPSLGGFYTRSHALLQQRPRSARSLPQTMDQSPLSSSRCAAN